MTFTKQSVCRPLTVNGRMRAPNGPTVRAAVWLVVSATVSERRLQAGQIGVLAVEADDRVVRPRVGDDLGDHVAVAGVDDVPVVPLERGEVDHLAVGRDRHPVAAALVARSQRTFSVTRSRQVSVLVVLM